MEFLKNEFDSNLVWRCDVLLSIYFIAIVFYIIENCKHVNATFVSDICLDIIYVELNFNCNGEIFSKLTWITLLTLILYNLGIDISLNILNKWCE